MNCIIIDGNLTRDPEFKAYGDHHHCKLSIGNNDGFGEKKKVSFIDINLWGFQADNAKKYLTKGDKVEIQGRLVQESWGSEDDKKYKHTITAEKIKYENVKSLRKENANQDNEIINIPF
jgi:single-strand DNA-binding protein